MKNPLLYRSRQAESGRRGSGRQSRMPTTSPVDDPDGSADGGRVKEANGGFPQNLLWAVKATKTFARAARP